MRVNYAASMHLYIVNIVNDEYNILQFLHFVFVHKPTECYCAISVDDGL
jgi:hypothetical protein